MNARDLLNLLDCEDYIDLTVKQFVDMLKEIEAEKMVEDEYKIIQHDNGETECVLDEEYDRASSNAGVLI